MAPTVAPPQPPQPTPPPPQPTPPPTTSSHYDCMAGAEYTWPAPKKVFCCLSMHKGCPTTPTPIVTTTKCPFDCNDGYKQLSETQWVKGWSGEKKIFCCRTMQRGCPSELPPPSGIPQGSAPPQPDTFQYDCTAGYHNCPACLVRQWSPTKIAYCCRTQGKGCNLPHPR